MIYLAIVQWDWPGGIHQDLPNEYHSKYFDDLDEAKAWAQSRTDDPDSLVKVYVGEFQDGEFYDVEPEWYYEGEWDQHESL